MEKHLTWYQILKRERQLLDLTQAEVAERISSDTKTVSRWERGQTFPNAYYRRKLVELYGKNAEKLGFTSGRDGEESDTGEMAEDTSWHKKWGEAPAIESFYGREKELTQVQRWIMEDHCRMVVVLGIGGIGKTSFATMVTKQARNAFDYVFWRSLQNAPSVESILAGCLQFVSDRQRVDSLKDPDEQISLLITALREHRCLLILDNTESVLQAGQRSGQYLAGYEGYGRLFQRVGETDHQSCLLLTSREKPKEVARMEGSASRVRSLSLSGVEPLEVQKLLEGKALLGSDETWTTLVHLYSGNPLALKLISEPIREVFSGDIATFLGTEKTVFGDMQDLLNSQFQRLSGLEQEIMFWLAIEREVVTLSEIQANLLHPISKGVFLEVFDSLRRRSMIETRGGGRFTLQPVITEYVTERFVEQMYKEIQTETIDMLGSHALIKAQANDFVRESQIRVILAPVAERLLSTSGKEETEKKLKRILATLRTQHPYKASYAAGKVLNLLVYLDIDMRGFDFSHLQVRQARLQEVALPKVNFTFSDLTATVFMDTFSNILCVAVSPNGELLAAGTTTVEVRLWQAESVMPLFTCLGHSDGVRSLAFASNDNILASGSDDQTIRLWDASTGQCLKILRGHTHLVRSVAFNRDGSILASCSHDSTVRLWDVRTGQCLKILRGHTGLVWSVAFSPNSQVLASSGEDQAVRIWNAETGQCLKVLQGHTHRVWSIAFSPDSSTIASSSDDQTVKIWEVRTGRCLSTLRGHTTWIRSVAFSPDGGLLASGSYDQTVRIWDVHTGQCLKTLQGHSSCIWSVAFSPVGSTVASGSDDGTIRLWDVDTGECIRALRSDRPYERMNIAGALGLTEAQKTSLKMLGAIEER